MTDFLEEARFFSVVGSFSSLPEVVSILENKRERVDYLFIDLETSADALPHFKAEDYAELRILLFTNADVYMVDRAKGDVLSSLINFEMNRNSPLKSAYKKVEEELDDEGYWDDDYADYYPQPEQNSLFVKSSNKLVRIPLEDLQFVESQKDYLFFHTSDQKVKVLARMKNLASRLDENKFIRIHRSYLVRIDRINTIEGELVYLRDVAKPLPIGPSYRSRLMDALPLV